MPVKVIECPRDAMQGISHPISTETKVRWMRMLMECGFDTLDCGSFVNPRAVPQMADTHEVLQEVCPQKGKNKFLVIVGNERGAENAASHAYVDQIGFPFSVNETFQLRNTNAGTEEAFERLKNIRAICGESGKELVAYISMAFGNPYDEPYSPDEVIAWAGKLADSGMRVISLADTTGTAHPDDITKVFRTLTQKYPQVEFGAHFHALPFQWESKIAAAWEAGCRRFDGAILGFGGCPMAKDELTGNIPTEEMLQWLQQREETGVDFEKLREAVGMAPGIYGS